AAVLLCHGQARLDSFGTPRRGRVAFSASRTTTPPRQAAGAAAWTTASGSDLPQRGKAAACTPTWADTGCCPLRTTPESDAGCRPGKTAVAGPGLLWNRPDGRVNSS